MGIQRCPVGPMAGGDWPPCPVRGLHSINRIGLALPSWLEKLRGSLEPWSLGGDTTRSLAHTGTRVPISYMHATERNNMESKEPETVYRAGTDGTTQVHASRWS